VKPEEYNTHRWTIYVRGPNNEDLSHGIAKVIFQLHPSFPQPVRELTLPPFEVTEKGWGEFEVSIRIVWRDVSEKALVLTHMLKLYPPLETAALSGPDAKIESEDGDTKEIQVEGEVKLDPVKSEVYDEVVFTDPTETFHRQLTQSTIAGNVPLVSSQEPTVQKYLLPYSDEDDFKSLLEAQKFLENELMVVKDRILRADCAANELDAAMMEVIAKAKSIPVPPPATAAPATTASTGTKRKKPSGGGSKKKKAAPVPAANAPDPSAAATSPSKTTKTE
jgi:YEATS domain-containing protein 4